LLKRIISEETSGLSYKYIDILGDDRGRDVLQYYLEFLVARLRRIECHYVGVVCSEIWLLVRLNQVLRVELCCLVQFWRNIGVFR